MFYVLGRIWAIGEYWKTKHDSLDQCPMPINTNQNIGIDLKYFSIIISIRINAAVLMDIDQHWTALGNDPGSPDKDSKYASGVMSDGLNFIREER